MEHIFSLFTCCEPITDFTLSFPEVSAMQKHILICDSRQYNVGISYLLKIWSSLNTKTRKRCHLSVSKEHLYYRNNILIIILTEEPLMSFLRCYKKWKCRWNSVAIAILITKISVPRKTNIILFFWGNY